MPSIALYRPEPERLEKIRTLLSAAGLSLDGDPIPTGSASCANQTPVLLVVLEDTLWKDEGLEAALIKAVAAARRVVGIWPEGAPDSSAPDAFKKYSTDQIIWDARRLRAVICGNDDPFYDSSIGTPQSTPATERNC